MDDNLLHYAKRLADYVRMSIEIGQISEESPLGIAYRDFMIEWKLYQPEDSADISPCVDCETYKRFCVLCPDCGKRR